MKVMYQDLSIRELCNRLQENKIELHTYISDSLDYVSAKDEGIFALLPETDRNQRLHREADDLLRRYPDADKRPPLFGLLVGVKDLFNVDGLETRAGSQLPAKAFRGEEAAVVTKLKELGALVLGKTVSTEFAYFSPGKTRNPLNPLHTPGGSSSGSAAAVAAGYCHLSLGTQTIASIVRPASYCGVYGFKPSWGMLSAEGVFPFSQSADHVGIIGKNVQDIAYVYALLRGGSHTVGKDDVLRIGTVRGTYLEQASREVRDNYADTLEMLARRGYQCVEIDPFGDIERLNTKHRRLIAAEFAQNHKALYREYRDLYSLHSQELYELGMQVQSDELAALKQEQLNLRLSLMEIMVAKSISVWVTPATTTTAPLGLESTGSPLMSLPWTNAGLPSLTVPNGMDAEGLPFGLQIIGAWQDDLRLLVNPLVNP